MPAFSHSGRRYVLGYETDFFGIWDRERPDQPVERFPRSDEGWRDAWTRFAAMEDDWVEVGGPNEARGPAPAAGPSWQGQIRPATSAGLASPLARLGARLVDGLIFAGVLTLLLGAGVVHVDTTSYQHLPGALIGLALLVSFLYETSFIAIRGQTPGKMALRIKVARADDGAVPGWNRAFVRWVVPVGASIVPFGALVVYLWLLWDRNRQGLHDKAAGTLVVGAGPTRT